MHMHLSCKWTYDIFIDKVEESSSNIVWKKTMSSDPSLQHGTVADGEKERKKKKKDNRKDFFPML